MYSFVFEWTPALTRIDSDSIPFGTIFATFMVGCMLGSQIFGYLIKFTSIRYGIKISSPLFVKYAISILFYCELIFEAGC